MKARTRSTSGSNTRSSSPSCTARRTTAMSIASTTRTSRTRTTSSFRRSTARTTTAASATYGYRQHLRRGLRGDAATIRRPVASRATSPVSPSRWTASSTRSSRKRTARSSATWRSSGYRWTCTGLAMRPAGSGAERGTGDHPFARSPVFLVGDSAMGSPYFQSISLGFECAMFLAGLLGQRDLPLAGHARSL